MPKKRITLNHSLAGVVYWYVRVNSQAVRNNRTDRSSPRAAGLKIGFLR